MVAVLPMYLAGRPTWTTVLPFTLTNPSEVLVDGETEFELVAPGELVGGVGETVAGGVTTGCGFEVTGGEDGFEFWFCA